MHIGLKKSKDDELCEASAALCTAAKSRLYPANRSCCFFTSLATVKLRFSLFAILRFSWAILPSMATRSGLCICTISPHSWNKDIKQKVHAFPSRVFSAVFTFFSAAATSFRALACSARAASNACWWTACSFRNPASALFCVTISFEFSSIFCSI